MPHPSIPSTPSFNAETTFKEAHNSILPLVKYMRENDPRIRDLITLKAPVRYWNLVAALKHIRDEEEAATGCTTTLSRNLIKELGKIRDGWEERRIKNLQSTETEGLQERRMEDPQSTAETGWLHEHQERSSITNFSFKTATLDDAYTLLKSKRQEVAEFMEDDSRKDQMISEIDGFMTEIKECQHSGTSLSTRSLSNLERKRMDWGWLTAEEWKKKNVFSDNASASY